MYNFLGFKMDIFNTGEKVIIKGVPLGFKRYDTIGVIVGAVPFESGYYRADVSGSIKIVNDSMMVKVDQ